MPAAPPIEHLPWFLMLSLAMSKPWRQTEGMLRSIIQMLGPDLPVPDHTTLSRRSARLSLSTTLKKPKGLVNVVIDSSRLKIFGAGEWLHEKHGGKPRRSWRRLHLAIDPDSSEILAAELTDEGDASLVAPARSDRWPDFCGAGGRRVNAIAVGDQTLTVAAQIKQRIPV